MERNAERNTIKSYLDIVSVILLDQYALHIYCYLKEWRKNPQWSFSCCLTLILPLNGLPGDISDLIGANLINNQVQFGDMEMPTIAAAVRDSEAINLNFEEGERGDGDPKEALNDSQNDVQLKAEGEEMPTKVASMEDNKTVKVTGVEGEKRGTDLSYVQDDNRFNTQAKNEREEMYTKAAAVQDGGEVDFPLEGEQGDVNSGMVYDASRTADMEDTGLFDVFLHEGEKGDSNRVKKKDNDRIVTQPKKEEDITRTNAAAMRSSGPVRGALENGGENADYPTKVQNYNCQDAEYSNRKRHQGTQTEFLTISLLADAVVHDPVKDASF